MSRTLGAGFVLGGFGLHLGASALVAGVSVISGPTAAAPARLADTDWTLVDAGSGGTLDLTLVTAPDDRGAPITAYEHQIDGTGWSATGLTAPGQVQLTGFTDGQAVQVALRAVNANGPALASALKTATPTGASPVFDLEGQSESLIIHALPDVQPPQATGDRTTLQITG